MATKREKKEEKVLSLQIFQGSKEERLQQLYNQWYNCRRCFLGDVRMKNTGEEDIVFGSGNPEAPIMLIGEAPGVDEEAQGVPFVGASGRLLNQMLAAASDTPEMKQLSEWYNSSTRSNGKEARANADKFHQQMTEWRNRHFFITNVVCCRPPDNRTPTRLEVETCWERLYNVIYIVDPVLIVCLGKSAFEAVMQKQMEITKYRGKIVDARIPGRIALVTYPLLPVFHPAYLLRKADWKTKGGDFDKTVQDLRTALAITEGLLREKRL